MKHPLKSWLAKQSPRKLMKDFAADLGVHRITLSRLVVADESVQRDLFEKVEKATGGELKAADLYNHYLRQRSGEVATDFAEGACAEA